MVHRLSGFPAGGILFIDANIFLEHFLNGEPSCTILFQRIRLREIYAVTSVLVLSEVRHRLLLTEAVRKRLVPPTQRALNVLRAHAEIIGRLNDTDKALDLLLEIPIRVVGI